ISRCAPAAERRTSAWCERRPEPWICWTAALLLIPACSSSVDALQGGRRAGLKSRRYVRRVMGNGTEAQKKHAQEERRGSQPGRGRTVERVARTDCRVEDASVQANAEATALSSCAQEPAPESGTETV